MKELPKKWCIRFGTYEQFLVIRHYFGNLKPEYRHYDYTANYRAWSNFLDYDNIECLKLKRYTEITFEDFRRLVLKENIDKTYELW
jgi:hypothetical protein